MSEAGARELAGRAAIVTGASRNIGRAIAVVLGQGGASVLVHAGCDKEGAEETARLVREASAKAQTFLGDLAEPGTAAKVAAAAQEAFGRLDILVNNAAIRPESPFADMAFAEWRRVMAICLDAVFLLSQAALPALRQSDCATIVNIGGLTGHTGARHRAHVVAAKAAVAGLTKAMAHDLAEDGVTVNCVAPGLIETRRGGGSAVARPHHHSTRTNVLGRRGSPEELAAMVRHLCGPQSRYVTGQTIHVNGGAFMS